jgi:DNA-binding XRE family transcriptional regulator
MSSKQTEVFLKKLSGRLGELRRKKGITQERLAEAADIDRVALANIETGRRHPTVTTVYKIATALDVRIEDVFKGL